MPLSLAVEMIPPYTLTYHSRYACGGVECEERWIVTEGRRLELGAMASVGGQQVKQPLRECKPVVAEPVDQCVQADGAKVCKDEPW